MATNQELKAQNDALVAEIAALKAAKSGPRSLSLKVGPAGGIVLSGMGQWPTTLYAAQWYKVAEQIPAILRFIEQHEAELSWKEGESVRSVANVMNVAIENLKALS